MKDTIFYINRESGKREEERVYGEGALRFLYTHPLGKKLVYFLAHIPFFSKFYGFWNRRRSSQKKIMPFVEKFHIPQSGWEQALELYPSFDAFFSRKLRKGARTLSENIIIPADGRYLFFENIETSDGFLVKGKKFSLLQLLGDRELFDRYKKGSMVIARLCPSDYHRFHFPVACVPSVARCINGPLFSVNPMAVKRRIHILAENKRVLTRLQTENLGEILFLEIGATSVGSIHQSYMPGQAYDKGDEKGYFSFGGSSLILLFEENRIQFDADLIKNSRERIETLCLFGQSMGSYVC